MRAHSESQVKSARSRANWARRRANLANEILTRVVPCWIDVEDGQPVLNPANAKVVRRMFKLCLEGLGCQAIAKLFTDEGVPTISGKVKHWVDNSIFKLLRNRACIGEWVPKTLGEDGKRHEVGEPVKGYFPAVVDEGTFYRAQEAIRRRKKGGGRDTRANKALHIANVFRGLVVSPTGQGYSHRRRNGHDYLVLKTGDTANIPYRTFEGVILKWLTEVKVELSEGEQNLQALEAQQKDLERRLKNLKRLVEEKGLDEFLDRYVHVKEEYKQVSEQIELARVPKQKQMAQARSLIKQMAEADDPMPLRRQIRQQLGMVVKKIVVEGVKGKPRRSEKRYDFTVHFTDGDRVRLFYETDGKGEIVDQGFFAEDVAECQAGLARAVGAYDREGEKEAAPRSALMEWMKGAGGSP
jgi:hypothetical protein